ncbi:YciI family protein [Actinokineospora xionganensis]|uniref:YciI family protein n=1 Tax=Actinokineospora xionganensis TaxID=2684470 RepID=A0ABR7LBC8_9PSEU|nr:YciI family protein [Actinokineospora xionganensis]MBC6449990.1 YciI family protein [Actinokineospora xionganensis]
MKYLILIHSNPRSLAVWETLTDEQRMEFGRGHMRLSDELAESGELIVSEGLGDPAMGKRVSVRDGRTLVTDGPFAEVKEHLAGFLLIECDSMEKATEIAARVPDAGLTEVEVRPVLDLSWLEH